MAMLGPTVAVGQRVHRVRFEKPGPPVPDGEGGWIESWQPLTPPELFAELKPVLGMNLEQEVSATLIAIATHIVTAPYHPQVTTKTRMVFPTSDKGDRVFAIASVANRDERGVDMILLCKEVVE